MNKIIGVDLDDVLSDTLESVLKYNDYKINGIDASKDDIIDYNLWHIPKFNISKDYALNFFLEFLKTEEKLKTPIVPGSYKSLKYFSDYGYTFKVVTARMDEVKSNTIKWLEKNFGDIIYDVYFTNKHTDKEITKGEVCKKIGASYLIDDNFDHCIEANKEGINSILITQPWNYKFSLENYENIKRLDNWNDLSID